MNGGQVTLAYNGLGQLVSKTANGVATQYLIDDLSPTGYPQVVEELVSGQVARTYTYGLERIGELQTVKGTPTASFYQYDGRGTVRMLTNSAGAVTDTYEYDAFGNEIAHTGSTPNAYLYRGERYDSDLGLYYLRARWYNPVSGRFMTRDPYEGSIYDPASLHRYNYSQVNPVNFVDPSGRATASDYADLGLSILARGAVATSFGFAVNCAYYSLASATNLVGQHIGQQVDQLGLLFKGCIASITTTQYATALAANTALLGLGEVGGWAIGKWLPELEEGEPALGCGRCFPAGTPVHTDHGTVPIESIRVGDKVWARNRETGNNELRTVTAVAPQHRDKLMELRIAGEEQALRVTPVHPFLARRNADEAAHWIEAGNLVVGEQIETKDGRWIEVQSVHSVEGLAVVYNFTVDKDHDYFVGETGFLVHNAGNCGCNYNDPYIRKWVRDELEEAQEYTEGGLRIDPNSGVPYAGPPDIGHRPGFELWKMKALAGQNGLTQQEFNEMMQDPEFYQYENPATNRSHCFELP